MTTANASRWIWGLTCLSLVAGCSRFFPSDPSVPGLALTRVGDRLEIHLPSCAAGVALDIRAIDNMPSEEATSLVILWEVHRLWPKGQTSFIVGEAVPGEQVRTALVPLNEHPQIEITVGTKGRGWSGVFDLRKVTAALSGGENYSKPITKDELDRIGGCGA